MSAVQLQLNINGHIRPKFINIISQFAYRQCNLTQITQYINRRKEQRDHININSSRVYNIYYRLAHGVNPECGYLNILRLSNYRSSMMNRNIVLTYYQKKFHGIKEKKQTTG